MEAIVVLVDTSAWIHHLRKRNSLLVQLLTQERVRTCDVVVGELQLGSGLPKSFISDLTHLPSLPSPGSEETRKFIERHRSTIAGVGVGWADVQIILTAAKAGARLHTSDRYVRRVCAGVGVLLG